MSPDLSRLARALVATLLLSACGGGGSEGGQPPNPPPPAPGPAPTPTEFASANVFTDPHFRACLQARAASAGWTSLDQVVVLECESRKKASIGESTMIASVAGAQQLRNLDTLRITLVDEAPNALTDYSRYVTSVEPLRRHPRLRVLELENQRVQDLRPLADVTTLEVLVMPYSYVTDIAPLAGLTRLRVLDLAFNSFAPGYITDLGPLRNLTALQELYLPYQQPESLEPLRLLTNLSVLDLTYCRVGTLQALSGSTSLRALSVADTLTGDLEAVLATLPSLEYLDISHNWAAPRSHDRIPDSIGGMQHLRVLYAETGQYSELGTLPNAAALRALHLTGNAFLNLEPLTRMRALTELSVREAVVMNAAAIGSLHNLELLDARRMISFDVHDYRGLWLLNLERMRYLGPADLPIEVADLARLPLLAELYFDGTNYDCADILTFAVANPAVGIRSFCPPGARKPVNSMPPTPARQLGERLWPRLSRARAARPAR